MGLLLQQYVLCLVNNHFFFPLPHVNSTTFQLFIQFCEEFSPSDQLPCYLVYGDAIYLSEGADFEFAGGFRLLRLVGQAAVLADDLVVEAGGTGFADFAAAGGELAVQYLLDMFICCAIFRRY